MKRQGFFLVEIMIAMVFASLAFSVVLKMPITLGAFWKKVVARTHFDIDRHHFLQFLENDLQACFVPEEAALEVDKPNFLKEEDLKEDESIAKQNQAQGPAPKEETVDQKTPAKYASIPFFLKPKGKDSFDFLFFYTTNRIPSFFKEKPRVAAVVYFLKEVAKDDGKSSYSLMRAEITDLLISPKKIDLAKLKPVAIATGLARFQISLKFYEPKQPESQDGPSEALAESNKNSADQLIETFSWPVKNAKIYSLPALIIVQGAFASAQENTFKLQINPVCWYRVKEDLSQKKELPKNSSSDDKKPAAQPNNASDKDKNENK